MLHFNYTTHIWPRCELILATGNKHFDLEEALTGSDTDFCKKYGFDLVLPEPILASESWDTASCRNTCTCHDNYFLFFSQLQPSLLHSGDLTLVLVVICFFEHGKSHMNFN